MEITIGTPNTVTASIGLNSGAVQSVNGKTGVVVLDYEDVGALSEDTVIPSKTSDLTNDSGFLTSHQSLAAYRTSAAQDVIDATKQATLVSGTNIKTINNTSILGSGNIEIQGGGGISSITAGTGLTGGTITTSGTIAVDTNTISTVSYVNDEVDAVKDLIPETTSDLTNDSGFITSSYHDSTKQDTLTAGTGISIANNVISATGTSLDNIFWATYGTTTYAEIVAADTAGKVVFCKTGTSSISIYRLIYYSATEAVFSRTLGTGYSVVYYIKCTSSNVWSSFENVLQPYLVSGTNIKTINNTSLLGSGNIDISSSATGIFWATYGTTTYTEIFNALSANKLVLCRYTDDTGLDGVFKLSQVGNAIYYFDILDVSNMQIPHVHRIYVDNTDTWGQSHVNMQTQLVSGTNVKTINGNSILGSGNLLIGDSNVIYFATYGTTTYAQVTEAFDAGKLVLTRLDGRWMSCIGYNEYQANFREISYNIGNSPDRLLLYRCSVTNSNSWAHGEYEMALVPAPPTTAGPYVLKATSGTMSWVAE